MLERDELWVDYKQLERACIHAMNKAQNKSPCCFHKNNKWTTRSWAKHPHLEPYYELVLQQLPSRYRKLFDMDLLHVNGDLRVMTARSMMRTINSWARKV